ncbi:uncharacterized protein L3040_002825 [Drepanopeziza brunnea f. sp. 'multigermtubi']|uniref:uncharacterized protein n=1 Tax=Drepanopeziza brunnea f. sp. 'multigermtubi' TaxID=698441 RepID=UPI00238F2A7C|nr:hypothetical protein L3040_002825 [Drepanopeziza brunnea f. sp. 'multigermtubi']
MKRTAKITISISISDNITESCIRVAEAPRGIPDGSLQTYEIPALQLKTFCAAVQEPRYLFRSSMPYA